MADAELPLDDLDALVSRVDPDRWLASRFIADSAVRADVVALYAFNHELARAAEVASQPLVGEIRLAWWRETLDEIYGGKRVRGHPAALALAEAVRRRGLARDGLEALIDSRLRDLDGWPLKSEEIEAYVDASRGGLMRLAAAVVSPEAETPGLAAAAQAWGLATLHRTGGRLPAEWDEAGVKARVAHARREANRLLGGFPADGFPVVAYSALSGAIIGGGPSELGKRARLTWAVLRGRI